MSIHLSRQNLGETAVVLVEELETWLRDAEFKPEGKDLHKCENHADFYNIMKRLINELEFVSVKDPVPGYNAFRIPATVSGPVDVLVSSGPAYLIPLHISKNIPVVSSIPFTPGTATLVTRPVKVRQGFEFLVIAPPQR